MLTSSVLAPRAISGCDLRTRVWFNAFAMKRQASTEVAISGEQAGLGGPAPFIVGVAGGTASGKTSVCRKIMEQLRKDVPVSRGFCTC